MYIVYSIEIKETLLYVGYTKDVKKRSYQHNYLLRTGKEKELYNYLREIGVESVELVALKSFKIKADAKRYECLLILTDYFGDRVLKQKCPNISDR